MPDTLKIALFDMNAGACSYPETAVRVAQAAEAAGFESLWAGEHVVLPDPQAPPSPLAPDDRILDPVIALTYLAAVTTRVRLGTGIIILPQRNPLVLAKEIASLDVLSGGRFIFGIGIGYLEPEFRALGIPFADKGPRTDDYLAAMCAIWGQPAPAHAGRFVQFAGIDAHPRPVQQPGPPVVVGGRSPGAYRRAVQHGDGWYGFSLSPESAARALDGIREAAAQHERPPALGPLEISVTPRGTVDRAMAEQYAALGVHRLILRPPGDLDADALGEWVGATGAALIGRV
jgi:probable F420-dependent oxidoreductase